MAQSPLYSLNGQGPGAAAGSAVAIVPDLNGDGFDEIVVGAPGEATNGAGAGAVRVYSGANGNQLLVRFGDGAGHAMGTSVAAAGDVNGDGVYDFIAGAPGASANGAGSGSARVYSGRDGSILYTFHGDGAGDALGTSVGGGYDVNLDGYDDLVAGAPGDDNNGAGAGSARVYSGRDGSTLHTFHGDAAGDAAGTAVALMADTDDDGAAEGILGAPGHDAGGAGAGMTRFFSGATGSTLYTFVGAAAGDAAGTAVSGAGDLDNDGAAEAVIGAPGADDAAANAGAAYVVSVANSAVLHTLLGQAADDAFGSAVAARGDADGDSRSDIAVGAPGADRQGADAGAKQVFSGFTGHLLFTVYGSGAGQRLGSSVAVGQDVDGDGYADSASGAPGDATTGAGAGSARVYALQPADRLVAIRTHRPTNAGALFGFTVSGLGDLDGDGVPDYAGGAPAANSTNGAVILYSGLTHAIIRVLLGPAQANNSFGHEVKSAGDIDQDGTPDILVGAWHWNESGLVQAGRAQLFSGRTGASLGTFPGTSFNAHMGTALGGLGDVDGDQRNDFFLGAGLDNNGAGQVVVYSGSLLAPIRTLTGAQAGERFGWGAASLGDLDGDGVSELAVSAPQPNTAVASPGYCDIYSGATGALLQRINGVAAGDAFGQDVEAAGDVNGDGVPDLIVGANKHDAPGTLDGGLAQVISGADWSVLYSVLGTENSEFLGFDVAGAGDVNGDGYADFLVGAPGASAPSRPAAGRVTLFSGYDGRELGRFEGDQAFDEMHACDGMGDVNRDGLADFLVGAPKAASQASAGMARVFLTTRGRDPGRLTLFGASCPAANGDLPRLGFLGRPRLTQTFHTTLATAPAGTVAFWSLGASPAAIELSAIQAPGCFASTLPVIVLPSLTGAMGTVDFPVAVPNTPTLVGGAVYAQWLIADAANPLGVITTNGGRIQIGR